MKKLKIVVLLCLNLMVLFIINSCTLDDKKIQGTYIGNFSKNIDSIKIDKSGFYERVIYDNNKNLIFKNKSTYTLSDGSIRFNDFLLNENDLNNNTKYDANDLLNANLNYSINLIGEVKFFVDYDNEYYYFKKQR